MATATICILVAFFMVTASRSEVLELKLGKIRGKTESIKGKKIDVYLGVPYAEPPLGPLRFQKPIPKKPWTRILDATEYGPSCMQMMMMFPGLNDMLSHVDISEDCLSLNIYAPESDNKEPKAVMVYIHGGGYVFGQGMGTPCGELALHGDIICVTINYRLGIFGFLSTLDESAPGNYGLWDQHEALKWVKEHISSFGGDPESITIFGESAGGSSVQHQAMTKHNVGVVKRAISQSSPTFSNGFSMGKNPLRVAKGIGLKLNCNTTDNQDLDDTVKLVNCLRLAPTEDLFNKSMEIMGENAESEGLMQMTPVEDGDFVPYGTKAYFSASSTERNPEIDEPFGRIDWMVGSLADEGRSVVYEAVMKQEYYGFNATLGIPEDILNEKFILPTVKSLYPDHVESVKKHIHDFYTHKTDPIENAIAMGNFITDAAFSQHVVESSLAHTRAKQSNTENKSGTYSYHISYVLSGKSVLDYLMGVSAPSWGKGALHGDDIALLFGTSIVKEGVEFQWNEDDAKAAETVMTYWTNFAKTGNPNKGLPLEGVATWEEYTKEKKGYINIGKEIKMENDLQPERMKLWMYTIPEEIEKQRTMKQKTEL